MTIIHSSDLGWKAGQDISDEFAALAQTFKSGDTFVLDHMYKISGKGIQLPDNFTLAGGAPGAGLDVIDTATNRDALINLGNANALVDLTITHSNTPNTGYEGLKPQMGVDFHNKTTFSAARKDDISVLNSSFDGNVTFFLNIFEGSNLRIEDTAFNGSNTPVRFIGNVDSPVIHNSLFQNALSDGIKTLAGPNAAHTVNASVSESVFLNNNRDGIDTTGGFRNSTVTDSYFINGFTGLDLKEIYDSNDDLAFGGPVNQNILITGSEFINVNNAVVTTTVDRGNYLTSSNATKWAVQDIRVEDSVVENGGEFGRIFLVKDSLNISWDNIALLGPNVTERKLVSDYNIGLPQNVSGTNVTAGDLRPSQSDAYYQSLAGPDWSNITYATDGPPTPADPVVEPDPIPDTPPPAAQEPEPAPTNPDPVVEAPAKDVIYGTGLSDLLIGDGQNNRIASGDGNDEVEGGAGNDSLRGDAGNDVLLGGTGADQIDGGAGADRLFGNTGWDVLYGMSGEDYLSGHTGADYLSGGRGADEVAGGSGNDKVYGNTGNDHLMGGRGADYVSGGAGSDLIFGNTGVDTLIGGSGTDTLSGGDGSDLLDGGVGSDLLRGGGRTDTFVFKRGYDTDRILDFADDVDHIDLRSFGFRSADQALSFARQSGRDVTFDFGSGDRLIVEDTMLSALTDDLLI